MRGIELSGDVCIAAMLRLSLTRYLRHNRRRNFGQPCDVIRYPPRLLKERADALRTWLHFHFAIAGTLSSVLVS